MSALLALLLATTGCTTGASSGDGSAPPTTPTSQPSKHPSPRPSRPRARRALAQLTRLPLRKRIFGSGGYRRTAFGPAWLDTDGNGCDQRDDVLVRDALPGSLRTHRQRGCSHDVLAGAWRDPYTGTVVRVANMKDYRQAGRVQIDHIVALGEAWLSGADRWTRQRRVQYANDRGLLVASDGQVNFAKGAKDPALWRPAPGRRCWYAIRWTAIKARWHLAVDPAERDALRQMLSRC